MRKPVVDYRQFRLSKLTTPEYSHLLWLLGWPVYFLLFFLTETFIPVEKCYPIHIWLDDVIPFCELFVIPYVGWYLLIVGSLVYFARYNIYHFTKLQQFIIFTQLVAMAVYIFFPNRQDLRPEVFPRENVFSALVGFIYSVDTNTGVFPSLHVGYSLAMASVWLKEDSVGWRWKTFVVVAVVLISLSTAFIKQHSVADGFAAAAMCLVGELLIFWKDFYRPRLRRKSA